MATQLSFTESMSGHVSNGIENPKKGEKKGKESNNKISFDVKIIVDDVNKFIDNKQHEAKLEGRFHYAPFGLDMEIENGKFNLFVIDEATDTKKMKYAFNFRSKTTGKLYYFKGVKEIERKWRDIFDPLDPVKDITTLFSRIYEGDSEGGLFIASGILRFDLIDLPGLIASVEVEAANNTLKRKAALAFFGFALGSLAETYLPMFFARFSEMEEEYDAVVIGSGFGGAVTAYKLAEKNKSVCILERGKKWRGKVNAKSLFDLVPMFKTPLNNGLFDYRISKNIHVLQSNGVGGGSLIYASVLIRPTEDAFDDQWPDEITVDGLKDYYKNAEIKLGARKADAEPLKKLFAKTEALKKGSEFTNGDGVWRIMDIAVQDYDETKNLGSCDELETESSPCRACGNCVLVCNRSSKNTLDLNYIKEAIEHGAELFAEHEVIKIEPLDSGKRGSSGYKVHYKDHSVPLGRERTVRAKKVIVAAGSLGSTELLLKCRDIHKELPNISDQLGKNFSGNGDLQSFAVGTDEPTDSSFGPTITSAIDFQASQQPGEKFIVEEGGFPEAVVPLANAFLPFLDNINSFPGVKDSIKSFIESENKDVHQFIKDIFKDLGHNVSDSIMDVIGSFAKTGKKQVSNTEMYLSIGKDASDGEMKLDGKKLVIDWDHTKSMPLFDNMKDQLTKISQGLGATFEANPLWSLLNILITVHPLGGCKMGKTNGDGVVDHTGKVNNYENLYVADGSIFPNALGVNPALTIAAIAERNADIMLNDWQ